MMQTLKNPSTTTGLAVFTKTPYLSPIKTRLAGEVGTSCAITLYQCMFQTLFHRLQSLRHTLPFTLVPHWAVGEKEALSHPLWKKWPTLWQGKGELGTKLHTIYSHMQSQFPVVAILGADSPVMDFAPLVQSLISLSETSSPRIEIGPSYDGGFYYLAGNTPIPQKTWEETPYSQSFTCEQLIHHLKKEGLTVHQTREQGDIDTLEDLENVLAAQLSCNDPQLNSFYQSCRELLDLNTL